MQLERCTANLTDSGVDVAVDELNKCAPGANCLVSFFLQRCTLEELFFGIHFVEVMWRTNNQ